MMTSLLLTICVLSAPVDKDLKSISACAVITYKVDDEYGNKGEMRLYQKLSIYRKNGITCGVEVKCIQVFDDKEIVAVDPFDPRENTLYGYFPVGEYSLKELDDIVQDFILSYFIYTDYIPPSMCVDLPHFSMLKKQDYIWENYEVDVLLEDNKMVAFNVNECLSSWFKNIIARMFV